MPTLAHGSRARSHRGRRLLSGLLVISLVALLLLLTLAARRQAALGETTCRSSDFVGGHLGLPQRVAAQQPRSVRHADAADARPAARQHKLAVVVPYRDRPEQLDRMLAATADCVRQGTPGADFDIFVIEQSPRYVAVPGLVRLWRPRAAQQCSVVVRHPTPGVKPHDAGPNTGESSSLGNQSAPVCFTVANTRNIWADTTQKPAASYRERGVDSLPR